MASPTHLANITAAIVGTMNSSEPVSSNIITTKETVILKQNYKSNAAKFSVPNVSVSNSQ